MRNHYDFSKGRKRPEIARKLRATKRLSEDRQDLEDEEPDIYDAVAEFRREHPEDDMNSSEALRVAATALSGSHDTLSLEQRKAAFIKINELRTDLHNLDSLVRKISHDTV